VDFCNTILEAHLRTASFSTHICTCGHVRKSSQVSAVESKELTADNIEFFTRTHPTLPSLIHTFAICSVCSYELSGEEIVSGWFASTKFNDLTNVFFSGDTKCPCCGTNVGPELKILHKGEHGKEIWSTVPLIRPHMLKTLLMKELKFLSVGSSPLLNLRLNTSLFWNLVWWFSMLNLPFQSIFGFATDLTSRTPVKFRMPWFEPWSVLFGVRDPEQMEEVPTVSKDIFSPKFSGEVLEAMANKIQEDKVALACNLYLAGRNDFPDLDVYKRSLYKTLAVLNKTRKLVDPVSFSRNFAAELLSEDFTLKPSLQQRDQLADATTIDRIWEFSDLLQLARSRFNHHAEPEYICTLLGMYTEMSFDPQVLSGMTSREDASKPGSASLESTWNAEDAKDLSLDDIKIPPTPGRSSDAVESKVTTPSRMSEGIVVESSKS
jgi:hypothetical protein